MRKMTIVITDPDGTKMTKFLEMSAEAARKDMNRDFILPEGDVFEFNTEDIFNNENEFLGDMLSDIMTSAVTLRAANSKKINNEHPDQRHRPNLY